MSSSSKSGCTRRHTSCLSYEGRRMQLKHLAVPGMAIDERISGLVAAKGQH